MISLMRLVVNRGLRTVNARIALAGLLVALGPSAAHAADWYVDDDGDCVNGDGSQGNPYCRIQQAIDAALDGDTLQIAPGTYFENLRVDKSVQLIGAPAPDVTSVDGSATGRAMLITTGIEASLTNLTLTNGSASTGSGLLVESSADVTLTSSTVTGSSCNSSYYPRGGGIANYGTLTLIGTIGIPVLSASVTPPFLKGPTVPSFERVPSP